MNNLAWLQSWYANQCDGIWEHAYGVSVGTVDNPGWTLEINLAGTRLAHLKFNTFGREGKEDWLLCRVDGEVFKATGGPDNLDEMIGVFRTWAMNVEEKEKS